MKFHKNGTYASLKVSEKSAIKIVEWAKKNKINNVVDAEYLHCTVVFSRKPVPELENWQLILPTTVKIKNWRIFPQQEKIEKALVLELDASKIINLHNRIEKDLHATYDFDEFIPHITISQKWLSNTVPEKLPNFNIELDKFEVSELDI